MSKIPKNHNWVKFYFKDWQLDLNLQSCSYGARGLWFELIGLMTRSERYGYLQLNNIPLTVTQIANLTNGHKQYVIRYLAELEKKGVLSKNEKGIIFCRRMVKHEDATVTEAVTDGVTDNVTSNVTDSVTDNARKPPKKQNCPIYKNQNKNTEQKLSPNGDIKFKSDFEIKKQGSRLPVDWQPSELDRIYALGLGLDLDRTILDFKDYWIAKSSKEAIKLDWSRTWQTWCRKAKDWQKPNNVHYFSKPAQFKPERPSKYAWMIEEQEQRWGSVQ